MKEYRSYIHVNPEVGILKDFVLELSLIYDDTHISGCAKQCILEDLDICGDFTGCPVPGHPKEINLKCACKKYA